MAKLTLLKLTKITPKHTAMLGELLLYFNGRKMHAEKKLKANPFWVEPIPLTKIYTAHKCNANDRKVVKLAANVFMEQVSRGSHWHGTCSTWLPRKKPHVNKVMLDMIHELFKENKEHIQNIRTFLNTPQGETVVQVTTTFTFKSKEQAELFKDLMQAIEIEVKEDDE